ncbi:MAG: N-acetylornithine carbamoyltransferase [Planctomycetes bacterium]|nr:N-acetylornithine carbamoyltransferase [Planctomycetota bacterium]
MAEQRAPVHLISLHELKRNQVDDLLDLSMRLKRRAGKASLSGKTVGLLFFRGSLRTRTSLEAATTQLGGNTINLSAASDFWELESAEGSIMDGRAPEHVKDAAAVLSCYVNALAIRPKPAGASWSVDRRDAEIRMWARHARVPVINMESVLWHPLQALADLMTMRESLGDLRGKKLAFVWTHSPTPANPAAVHSLLLAAISQGMHVRVGAPAGYELDSEVMSQAQALAQENATSILSTTSMPEAARGAHVVYARSWHSLEDYGNPTLAASRRSRANSWMIDEKLMASGAEARLMHAMPVRRNLEVTDEVLDGPRSLIVQQAENRLHSQKAVLSLLLGS